VINKKKQREYLFITISSLLVFYHHIILDPKWQGTLILCSFSVVPTVVLISKMAPTHAKLTALSGDLFQLQKKLYEWFYAHTFYIKDRLDAEYCSYPVCTKQFCSWMMYGRGWEQQIIFGSYRFRHVATVSWI
jgi:hypothetical protein